MGLADAGRRIFAHQPEHPVLEVLAHVFRCHLVLLDEELAIGKQAGRHVFLAEEVAQDGLLLQRRLAFPVAFQQLFDVFVVHVLSVLL